MRARALGLLAAVLMLAATVIGTGPVAASAERVAASSSAPGADADAPRIVLTAIEPTVVTAGTDVVVRGSLPASSSAQPEVTVSVRLGGVLNRRDDVTAWSRGTTPANGPVLASVKVPARAAGKQAAFALKVPRASLNTFQPYAAIPVSVEAANASGTPVASPARTFLLSHLRKEYEPLRIAWLVPVTPSADARMHTGDAAARTKAWDVELGAGSRVQSVLAATAGTPATLAVDPSVLGPIPPGTAPSGSANAGTKTPATAPGGPSAATVAAIRAALAGRDLAALPHDDMDVAFAADNAPDSATLRDLVNRSEHLRTANKDAVLGIAWPADGAWSGTREAGMRRLYTGTAGAGTDGPRAVVVHGDRVADGAAYTPPALRRGAAGTRVLADDPQLSTLLPAATARGSDVTGRQALLAETLVLMAERPGAARTVLVTAPRGTTMDPAATKALFATLGTVPWVQSVPLSSLLDAPLDKAEPTATPMPAGTRTISPSALTRARLDGLERRTSTAARVATVLRDGPAFRAQVAETVASLTSNRWRGNVPGWEALDAALGRNVQAATGRIGVVDQSYNFLAESGTLQVTVNNDLGQPVNGVRLRLTPSNARMRLDPTDEITIGAHSKTTVRVPATALAAGHVDIHATLVTADGQPIGRPAVLSVEANPLSNGLFWGAGVVLALILVAGLVRAARSGTSRVDPQTREEIRAALSEEDGAHPAQSDDEGTSECAAHGAGERDGNDSAQRPGADGADA